MVAALVLGVYGSDLVPGLSDGASFLHYLVVSLGMVALALVVTHRIPLRAVPAELGMDRSVVVGLGWSLLLTLPMLIGFVLMGRVAVFEPGGIDVVRERPWAVLQSWAGAGLIEETLTRGYLFRQLVVRARWPRGRAILVGGLVFGLLHVPAAWGGSPADIAGAVVITAIGGAGFCWLLAEWDWNLWFVVGWHTFVNLWWMLGQAGDTVGGPAGGVLRIVIVVLTVVVTVNRHRLPTRWFGRRDERPADRISGIR